MWDNVDQPDLRRALELEDRTQVIAATSADAEEARAALLERRPAQFRDA